MHYNYSKEHLEATIYLKVSAGAKNDLIQGFIKIDDNYHLKLSVSAAPQDGKANIAIIKLLTKAWNLKNNQLEIIKGHTANIKLLSIKNISKIEMENLISKYQLC